jgi:hypothetical protein
VVAVVSNQPDVFALQRAAAAGVPAVHVGVHHGEARSDYDARLADVVAGFDPDLVVLAGWMRILTMSFLGWFPHRVVNLHPALPGELPGTNAIERAWDEAVAGTRTTTGVMVHLVPDEGVDDGPVLATATVPSTWRQGSTPSRNVCTPPSTVCWSPPSVTCAPPPAPSRRFRMSESTRTNPNDDFFDRFEALTFDDVVVVPGYSETLPDAVDTSARFAPTSNSPCRWCRPPWTRSPRAAWRSPWPATAASA